MPSYLKLAAVALSAMVPLGSAQTYSDCNPLHKQCSPDKGMSESTFDSDFTKGDSALDAWKTTAGHVKTGSNGAEFTINKKGDAPTIQTPFYFFYGKVDVKMKIAPGTGIVSSVVMESDDLDEIDWEGLGSFNNKIETNYFGKGDTTTYDRESYPPVDTPVDTWHTYTIDWQEDHITWSVDGKEVRSLSKNDAKGGSRFPQTPMNLRIGIWAGGDPSNGQGTIEWAGGKTDYSQAPFTMYIDSVHIENANPAKSYTYSDQSGSSDSIKLTGAVSGSSSSSSSSESSTQTTMSTMTTGSSATTTGSGSGSTGTTGSSSETTTGSSSGSGSGSSTASSSSSPSSSSGAGSGSGPSSSSGSGSGSGSGASSSSGAGSGSGSSSGAGSASSSGSVPPVSTGGASALTGLCPLTMAGLITAMLF